MKIETMPKETLAELLLFLAEHEEFASVENLLVEELAVSQVRAALREIATALKQEAIQEEASEYHAQKDGRLSKEVKTIISYLSPGEEKSLLQAFGLIDKTKSAIKS